MQTVWIQFLISLFEALVSEFTKATTQSQQVVGQLREYQAQHAKAVAAGQTPAAFDWGSLLSIFANLQPILTAIAQVIATIKNAVNPVPTPTPAPAPADAPKAA
jgi:hypothetical protein